MRKLSLTGMWVLLVIALGGCHHSGSSSLSNAKSSQKGGPGTATVSWDAPTTTTSGSALTDLAGYRIYFGTDAGSLTQTVQLSGIGVQTYVIDNLGTGTWFFAVKAVTSLGVESPLSDVV
ncbi:MAG: fibronectin type III domain-containing protein, partial [Gammaproteobacteria bacterium]|nr:fibronectin type III domain-containing protein [Gammaproteobacteria bacterium]